MVASAPAPTMDARFGTPVLTPIPSVAHLSSTSIVEEAAVGPSSSPESSTPLRQVGVTLISFLTRSPASGAGGTIVHITQGGHALPPISGAKQCCRGQMAIEGTACPHARTTTSYRLARRRSGRLLAMAGRDPNSPGTVIFAPTIPLALSKSRISRNGFGPLPAERCPQCCGAVGCPPGECPVGLVARRPISALLCRTPANMFATVQNRGATGTVLVVSSPPTIICARNVMSFMALFPDGEKTEKSAYGASSEAKRDARAGSCPVTVSS